MKCDLCNTRILKKTRKDCIYPSGAAMRLVYHFIVNWCDDAFCSAKVKYFYYNTGDVGL